MEKASQLTTLLELPDVEVFAVVTKFTGKRLGTISACGCTFSDQCPLAKDTCDKLFSEDPTATKIAVLTPKHPDSEITRKNIRRSHCQVFDPSLVMTSH